MATNSNARKRQEHGDNERYVAMLQARLSDRKEPGPTSPSEASER